MYQDAKVYIPPEKTTIERTADALKMQDTMNNIAEGVLQLIQKKEEDGSVITVTIELPTDLKT